MIIYCTKVKDKKYRTSDILIENEFTNQLKNELTCGVCLDILDAPIQCIGGHSWCHHCIIQSGRENCPICPNKFNTIGRNIIAANLIGKLSCKCPSTLETNGDSAIKDNCTTGLKRTFTSIGSDVSSQEDNETCDWTGEVDQLENHLKTCKHLLRACSLAHKDCLFQGNLNQLTKHYRIKNHHANYLLCIEDATRLNPSTDIVSLSLFYQRRFPISVDFAFPDGSVHVLSLQISMMSFKRCDISFNISNHDDTLDYTGTIISIKDETNMTENDNFVAICQTANEMHLTTKKGINIVKKETCIFPCSILNCWNESPSNNGELLPERLITDEDVIASETRKENDEFLRLLGREEPLYLGEKFRLKVTIKCRRRRVIT